MWHLRRPLAALAAPAHAVGHVILFKLHTVQAAPYMLAVYLEDFENVFWEWMPLFQKFKTLAENRMGLLLPKKHFRNWKIIFFKIGNPK